MANRIVRAHKLAKKTCQRPDRITDNSNTLSTTSNDNGIINGKNEITSEQY